jgi:type IV fimbrial biogenesis protein FimT
MVVTIVGLGLSAAVPDLTRSIALRQLEGAAAQLETHIAYARMAAVSRNEGVRLSLRSAEGGSCYVVHTGAAGQCTCSTVAAPVCSASAEALAYTTYPENERLTLRWNTTSILFHPDKGTSTPTGTLRLSVDEGTELRQIVNLMGRVRTCSPAGAVRGYPAC